MFKYNKFPHPGRPLFSCLSCDRMFSGIGDLRAHVKQKHTDRSVKKKLQFSMWDYSCDRPSRLKLHEVTHTKVKAFKCTVCDKSFTKKGGLTKHIKSIHTKESKYQCQSCDKIFNLRSNLFRHLKTVHDKIKSFVCDQCGKKFGRNGHLTRHMRIHTNDKPYKCSFCEKSFTQLYSLKSHQITNHTGQFPHLCKFCPKGFMVPGKLRKHVEKFH